MMKITTEEYNARFDWGEYVTEFPDISTANRPNQALKSKQAHTCKPRTSKQKHARKLPVHQ